ncbi:MAG: hypothetical protein IPF47_09130 [Gemmatimonadetes bacterium]|nr:hypothetical protein [Gemmatimonadota bacterium]
MTKPRGTVGVGNAPSNPVAGPPMLCSPIISAIRRHPATDMTSVVSSRNRAAASRISARFRWRGTFSDTRMSEMTSCIECKLSKIVANSG